MKKILTLMVALLTAFNLFAADIIVTRDARRIEAKILEVSSSEIKYKEANNLEGPTFVLTAAEINTIIYNNGTVKVFDQPATQPAQQTYSNAGYSNAGYNKPAFSGLPITKTDDYYYMGDQRMTEDQYLEFIKQNCATAWESYSKGNLLWKQGWALFGVGMGLMIPGAVLYSLGMPGVNGRYDEPALWIPGVIFLTSGSILTTASIPCLIVGGIKKYNSHSVYNETCASKQQAYTTPITFGITAGSNGVGVAMNF